MNKKIIFSFLSVLILISSLLVFTGCQEEEKEDEVIKIGAILPLTGDQTTHGEKYKKSLILAEQKINKENKKIELIIEDGQGNSQKSLSAARNLIGLKDVDVILTAFSGPTRAIGAISDQEKVVVMGNTGTNRNNLFGTDYFFPIGVELISGGEYFGEQMDLRCKELGLLSENIEPGIQITKAIKSNYGGNISFEEYINYGEKDFKTQITKLKEKEVDCTFFFLNPQSSLSFVQQMNEQDFDSKLFVTGYTTTPDFIEKSNGLFDNLTYFENNFQKNTSDFSKEYFESYEQKYQEKPTPLGGIAYDMLNIIYESSKICDTKNAKCIKEGIREMGVFYGVMGTEKITEKGDILLTDFMLKKITN